MLPRRRVVVTGMGMVTPIGIGVESFWRQLQGGVSGVRLIGENVPEFSRLPHSCRLAALVDEAGVRALIPKGAPARLPDFISYALVASTLALRDAQFERVDDKLSERFGVAIGSGIGSIKTISAASSTLDVAGQKHISPFFVPSVLINLAAGNVSIQHRLRGPNIAPATACAAGAHAIGDAARFIERGDADVMLAGGTEGSVDPLSVSGFFRMRALSGRTDEPQRASRPFDRDRDGFVIGEGAALLVLEEREHALRRKVPIYAEFLGYGLSGDAHHISAPLEDGSGIKRCMLAAMRDARVAPGDLDYVNAHATSTPRGDLTEAKAIYSVLGEGDDARRVLVSSIKGATGHALGAAGAIEAAATVLSISSDVAPVSLNLEALDDLTPPLNFVRGKSRPQVIRAAMTNSFGFGGTNVSLVFGKHSNAARAAP
jgi:3-oxoacyl-[acyl-carrier-protein] synthase II